MSHACSRARGARFTVRLTLLLASGAVGCNARFDGLIDLLDGTPEYLAFPGERLAAGSYSGPSLQGTTRSGPHLVAFEYTPAPQLEIRRLGSGDRLDARPNPDGGRGSPCTTGPASGYQYAGQLPSSLLQPFVPALGPDATGQSQLAFYDFSCKSALPPLPTDQLPDDASALLTDPPRFVVVGGDGTIFLADPWHATLQRSPHPVQAVEYGSDYVWTVEEHQLVVRDYQLEEVARMGRDVTDLARNVYTYGGTEVAYVDGGTLYGVRQGKWLPYELDSDVCALEVPSGWKGRGISYQSPCAQGRLVLLERSLANAPGGTASVAEQRFVLSAGVRGSPVVARLRHGDVVLFETEGDTPERLALWGAPLDGPVERLGSGARLSKTVAAGARVRLLVDWDGTTGRLVSWQPGAAVRELARAVAQVDDDQIIAEYDGEAGELRRLSGEQSEVIARGVPVDGVVTSSTGMAVLAEYDGSAGTLLAAAPDHPLEQVAERVHPGSFDFMLNMDAVVYIRDHDPEQDGGVLGVRTLSSADRFETEGPVSEWNETGWPSVGLLYVVRRGPRAGVWYAKAK